MAVVNYLYERDKLSKKKKRPISGIDFAAVIDRLKLGKKFYQFIHVYKSAHPRCKSIKRMRYLFLKHCKVDFRNFLDWEFNIEEAIRIAKTPWLDEEF